MGARLVHYSDVENAFDRPRHVGRLAALIRELAGPDALVCGTGDNTGPGVLSLVARGRQSVPFFEAIDADLETFGNHDFDHGPAALAAVVRESPQTWLTANVHGADGERFLADETVPTAIRTVGDLRVGVTAVTGPDTPEFVLDIGDVTMSAAVPALREAVADLRSRDVDRVVVLSHLGRADHEVARRLDVDVVLGGHAHDPDTSRVAGTLCTRPGVNGRAVTTVDLTGTPSATRHVVPDEPQRESDTSSSAASLIESGAEPVVESGVEPVAESDAEPAAEPGVDFSTESAGGDHHDPTTVDRGSADGPAHLGIDAALSLPGDDCAIDVSLADASRATNGSETASVTTDGATNGTARALVDALERVRAESGLTDVVGTASRPLDRSATVVRGGEARVGTLVAESLRWVADADVGLQNTGGIRQGPPLAGEVTAESLVSVVPFDVPVATVAVSGATLADVLAEGDAARVGYGEPGWWLAHVAGASFTYDRDAGTVGDLRVDGTPVDPDATYTLAVSEFLCHTDAEFPTLTGMEPVETHAFQWAALVEYVRERGIDPSLDGRITFR